MILQEPLMKNLIFPVTIFCAFISILSGCSGAENLCARVYNDTDQTITLYYYYEYDYFDEDVYVEEKKEKIKSQKHELIKTRSVLWDGWFLAEYDGVLNYYEVDEELFGCRDVHVRVEDYHDPDTKGYEEGFSNLDSQY